MDTSRRNFLIKTGLVTGGASGLLLSACGSAHHRNSSNTGSGGNTSGGGTSSGGGSNNGGGGTPPTPPQFNKTTLASVVALSPGINTSFSVSTAGTYTLSVATGTQRSMMILDEYNRARLLNKQSYSARVTGSLGFHDVFLEAGTYYLMADNLSGTIVGEVDSTQQALGGQFVSTLVHTSGVIQRNSKAFIPLTIEPNFFYVARGCSTFLRAVIVRSVDVQQVAFEWDLGGSHLGDTCPWSVLSLYPEEFYIQFAHPTDLNGGYACHVEKWKATG